MQLWYKFGEHFQDTRAFQNVNELHLLQYISPFFQRMYFHEPTGQCFELYKQGPCPEGHILSFNYGSLSPQCKCKDGFHLHSDGKCYRLNTGGSTRPIQLLKRDIIACTLVTLTAQCTVDFFPRIRFIPKHLELHASLEKLTILAYFSTKLTF